MHPPKRMSAYTLIELIITIAILAVLTSLGMAAVQRSVEAVNAHVCANNLRQIGIALRCYHDNNNAYPSNGGWDGQQTIPDGNGSSTIQVSTYDNAMGKTFNWGVGDPQRTAGEQTGSWAYAILPYHQERIYEKGAWGTPVPLYACPSRRPSTPQFAVNDHNGNYTGGSWAWCKIDYAANSKVFANRETNKPADCVSNDQIDTLANTILIGEKAMDTRNRLSGTWYWDEPYFVGGSGGTRRGLNDASGEGTTVLRDGVNINFRWNWGSAHPNCAHFLFADGSVRHVSYNTSVSSWLNLDGGGIAPDY